MPLSEHGAIFPGYYKIVAPRYHGTGTKIIIDSDMIVTGHLGELIRRAEAGKVVAYPDPESQRWFAEWEQIYEFSHAPRRQVYLKLRRCLSAPRPAPSLAINGGPLVRRA
ncbi:MAG: hypothetical protein ABIQ16_02935 [Polyangiaceae bacterium]